MTNVQLYLAYIIPTVLMLIGLLLNRSDNAALRADLAVLRSDMAQNNTALRSEMVQLRDSIHRDMISLHERVAVVEAKHT